VSVESLPTVVGYLWKFCEEMGYVWFSLPLPLNMSWSFACVLPSTSYLLDSKERSQLICKWREVGHRIVFVVCQGYGTQH